MKKSQRKSHRKKSDPRKKSFIVYGKFFTEREGESHIELWKGEARSMVTAVRKAVRQFWRSRDVRWKHHRSVNIHVTLNDLLLEKLPESEVTMG